jgi:glycerol-3-phosphate dehydrogenase (NAD(P)+)
MTTNQRKQQKISFIGAGTIGTALGNIIAEKNRDEVILHSIEKDVVTAINKTGINIRYFPMIQLQHSLKATNDNTVFTSSDYIFLAIPSVVLMDYLNSIKPYINPQAVLINLAKGFGSGSCTIVECIEQSYPNPVCTLKGPTFAREIINRLPSGFTLGYKDDHIKQSISDLFTDTTVYLDYSKDIKGVEILSILKNIYAIVIGIVDAHFNSPNLRSLILTKAFSEMRGILKNFGACEETMFKYCGIGDFTHTALNDLSRNRTLGLLIGKGFFTQNVSHELVLEGKSAVNIIFNELNSSSQNIHHFPILNELFHILNNNYQITSFIKKILQEV